MSCHRGCARDEVSHRPGRSQEATASTSFIQVKQIQLPGPPLFREGLASWRWQHEAKTFTIGSPLGTTLRQWSQRLPSVLAVAWATMNGGSPDRSGISPPAGRGSPSLNMIPFGVSSHVLWQYKHSCSTHGSFLASVMRMMSTVSRPSRFLYPALVAVLTVALILLVAHIVGHEGHHHVSRRLAYHEVLACTPANRLVSHLFPPGLCPVD